MWVRWFNVLAEAWERCWLSWACWGLAAQRGAVQRADARWIVHRLQVLA